MWEEVKLRFIITIYLSIQPFFKATALLHSYKFHDSISGGIFLVRKLVKIRKCHTAYDQKNGGSHIVRCSHRQSVCLIAEVHINATSLFKFLLLTSVSVNHRCEHTPATRSMKMEASLRHQLFGPLKQKTVQTAVCFSRTCSSESFSCIALMEIQTL